MVERVESGPGYGRWLLLASAVGGVAAAAVAMFREGNGIAYSGGAILVLVSTALLLVAALILCLYRSRPRWLTVLLAALMLLDLIGTGLAAYFLEAQALLALMALGLVGWLVFVLVDPGDARRAPPATMGRAVSS
jgi:hypothetical protein